MPLAAEVNERHFKCLFMDIGLIGLRFNAAAPGLLRDSTRLPDGDALDYHLLPLYLVGQARRLAREFRGA